MLRQSGPVEYRSEEEVAAPLYAHAVDQFGNLDAHMLPYCQIPEFEVSPQHQDNTTLHDVYQHRIVLNDKLQLDSIVRGAELPASG